MESPLTMLDRVSSLVFLDRLLLPQRLAAALIAVITASIAALFIDNAHLHFASEAAAGTTLNPIAKILADGSSLATAWPGWVAAAFFILAVYRLRRDPAEPPAGRSNETRSVADLRAGLRSEYTTVRIALVVVLSLTLIEICRTVLAIATARREGTAGTVLAATGIETLGLVAAVATLGVWAWLFRGELERWGAL